ncbi:MAG TPA: GTPase HflX [Candidatus Eisenbacteria bacterium]|nr:GTPase HflX [Candidatus Eisenbacteria bacterium]
MVEQGMRALPRRGGERAVLVGVELPSDPPTHGDPLDELGLLAKTAGVKEVGRIVQRRRRPDASTFLGAGKAAEVAALAREHEAEVVIFDVDLSPGQIRNLERILGVRVVDRTELILDIFALHARTHQARLQVELAQAQYLLPRLRRMWTHLSREVGMGAQAGIGMRGPGEKQIEIDRRILRRKIDELRRELRTIAERRKRMAQSRDLYYTVSLVGYTNAGKSTLLRRLTGADAYVADQLFATLDTQTRAWTLPGKKQVFLSDTVGFIRNLPHHLVASFYATLEEVRTADLILHVVDASHPDARLQIEAVDEVLREIGAEGSPRIVVLNKTDRVGDPLDLALASAGHLESVQVSALTGAGLDRLAEAVEKHILEGQCEAEFRLPAGEGKLLAWLADRGTILDRVYEDGVVAVRVRMTKADLARAARMVETLAH